MSDKYLGPISVAISGVSVLGGLFFGSGFVKWLLSLHTRVAMLETANAQHTADIKRVDGELTTQKQEVAVVKNTLDEIRAGLKKLDALPDLKATVESMKDRLDEKFSQIVPRIEHEARWQRYDEEMAELRKQKG